MESEPDGPLVGFFLVFQLLSSEMVYLSDEKCQKTKKDFVWSLFRLETRSVSKVMMIIVFHGESE